MIRLANVSKDYDGSPALKEFTLEVGPGQVVGFLGPNGAGKTTTIKLLMGMLFPTAGTVEVDGLDPLVDPIAVRHRVGYLPDVPFLYEYLSPREMLSLVGALYPIPPATVRERSEELFVELGIEDRADLLINGLSKGMRKKVALALALLHAPRVLLLDEPTSGLDPQRVRILKDRIRRERARGTTVLLSTHVLDVAEEVSTAIAVIHRGRLVYAAGLDEALARARSEGRGLEDLFLDLTSS